MTSFFNALLRLSPNHLAKSSTIAISASRLAGLLLVLLVASAQVIAAETGTASEIERFKSAWEAASKGDHQSFDRTRQGLQGYLLYPYLRYEDYRNRRRSIATAEMATFLDSHRDWAFEPGLRKAWLKALAQRGRWADLLAHSDGLSDTVLECQRIRARIILKQTGGIESAIQKLWTVGESQPRECDIAFTWLIKNHGISESLAWERIYLAMARNNRNLVKYLARFVPSTQRKYLDQWRTLSRGGYTRIRRLEQWQVTPHTREMAAISVGQLARRESSLAAESFDSLAAHFDWPEQQENALWRDIALYSAVALEDETSGRMERVPVSHRDSQLLEWWARFLLSRQNWAALVGVIGQMETETRQDSRWQYWLAQAYLRSGQTGQSPGLGQLADKANYYGFLSADELGLAYNICELEPSVSADEVERMAATDGLRRALELRKAGLENWAMAEWSLVTQQLDTQDLDVVAALAVREDWPDRAIFALGNSGDLQFYTWRFPLAWETDIRRLAAANKLDPAWVLGTIRSESAMVESARSSANALGLMQVTPATGRQVASKHGLAWQGSAQLQTAAGNLPIGTAYMADLLQEFSANPVLVSGAYNAGPNAVQKWLKSRPRGEAAIWIETLPYYETRDYIPRVLAFTTLYRWRMGEPVTRISARMPDLESGKIRAGGIADVECRDQAE